VFRHFERKEDIFLSALRASFGPVNPRLQLFDRGSDVHPPEDMLPQILSLLVDVATFSPELTKLVAVAFLELHGKAEEVCYEYLTPLFTSITRFLTANMQKGRLRNLNPEIVAVAMALTAIAQPELSRLIGGSSLSQMSGRESIDEYSRFWQKVLVPSTQESVNGAGVAAEAI
jgi:AcrR family transcriptional regulator